MELACVVIGGALGSISRFWLGKWLNDRFAKVVPVGTWFINLIGAILLGWVVAAVQSPMWMVLLADGFLGAFTTFSTFMQETYRILVEGKHRPAWFYLTGTVLTGILGFVLGHFLGA